MLFCTTERCLVPSRCLELLVHRSMHELGQRSFTALFPGAVGAVIGQVLHDISSGTPYFAYHRRTFV